MLSCSRNGEPLSKSHPLHKFIADHYYRAKYDTAAARFQTQTPSDYNFPAPASSYNIHLSQTRRTESERRYLSENRDKKLRELVEMESRMNITVRWQPSSPEYIQTLKYTSTRQYHRALDNLQRLVIQRLFELHKLNLSQTGKLMKH
jgi:hypothetical protein